MENKNTVDLPRLSSESSVVTLLRLKKPYNRSSYELLEDVSSIGDGVHNLNEKPSLIQLLRMIELETKDDPNYSECTSILPMTSWSSDDNISTSKYYACHKTVAKVDLLDYGVGSEYMESKSRNCSTEKGDIKFVDIDLNPPINRALLDRHKKNQNTNKLKSCFHSLFRKK